MKPMVKKEETSLYQIENCHNGTGALRCRSMLDTVQSEKFSLFHYDDLAAGVSIGNHTHLEREEIYYLLSGSGILTYDGVEYEMNPGDISVCGIGHSHGFLAKTDSVLIVVESR